MKQLVLLCGILVSSMSAWAVSEIQSVDTKAKGKEFTAVYSVSEPLEDKDLKINFRPRSVELVFSGTSLAEKSIVRVDHAFVDRVYSANKDGKVFSRIILKEGLDSKSFENRIGFEVKENKVFLKIAEKNIFPAAAAADLDAALDKEVAKVLSQEMPEKQMAKDIPESAIQVLTKDKEVILKESEIPVLTDKVEKKASSESPYGRLIMSFLVIAIFGAAVAMVSRWWKKRNSKNTDTQKIKMITQHFLGPKKSLAIVRVAGETMLIGVTDHSINMIKSLSLLDEGDIDNIDPTKSFGDVLQTQVSRTAIPGVEEEEEDFSFKQIKDRISNRVKEMRPL